MRKWLLRGALLAGAVAAAIVLRSTVFAPRPIEVEVVEIGKGRVESTITNTRAGTVEARRRAELSPQISGLVIELPHASGDRVTAGELLLRLDANTQSAQFELARKSLEAARSRHAESCVRASRAEREYERNELLAEDSLISADLLDGLASALEQAQANCVSFEALVAEARARVKVAETELLKTTLNAPFDGVLAEISVELGEYVTPSPPGLPIPPVMDLIDTTSIYVSAPMDEVDTASLHAGLPVRVTLDPYRGQDFEGSVVRVAPYVLDLEKQNRTVEIEVELTQRQFAAGLLPGTSADVEVILEQRDDVLRLPTATLLEGGRVLLLEAGVLVERRVEAGLRNWDWTEVISGLSAGDRIVTSLGDIEVVPGAQAVVAGEEAATH